MITGESRTHPALTSSLPLAELCVPSRWWRSKLKGVFRARCNAFAELDVVDVLEGWAPFQPESRNQWNIGIPEDHLFSVNAVTAQTPQDVIAGATAGGLELSDPETVEVGGVPAQRYDVVGGEGYMFETEFAEFGMNSTTASGRLTLLEVDGRVIAIVELVPLDSVEASRAETQRMIDSIEWFTAPGAG